MTLLDRTARLALNMGRPLVTRLCRGCLSILIYHRVLPEPDVMRPGDPTIDQFEWQMALLKREFEVLGLNEAIEALQEDRLPDRAICVTFDDGYADNVECALPVLRRHAVHATFFIATGFLDGGRMWNDTVIDAVRTITRPVLDLTEADLGRHPLGDETERRQAAEAIIKRVKYLPFAEREDCVQKIAARAEAELPSNLMMTSEQVRQLADSGMEVGGHTVNHPILAGLDRAEALGEIRGGKDTLECLLGREVRLFAYPNGKAGVDFRDDQVELVREAGFSAAVTTEPGVSTVATDPWRLPRFTPWDREPTRFQLRLLRNTRRVP